MFRKYSDKLLTHVTFHSYENGRCAAPLAGPAFHALRVNFSASVNSVGCCRSSSAFVSLGRFLLVRVHPSSLHILSMSLSPRRGHDTRTVTIFARSNSIELSVLLSRFSRRVLAPRRSLDTHTHTHTHARARATNVSFSPLSRPSSLSSRRGEPKTRYAPRYSLPPRTGNTSWLARVPDLLATCVVHEQTSRQREETPSRRDARARATSLFVTWRAKFRATDFSRRISGGASRPPACCSTRGDGGGRGGGGGAGESISGGCAAEGIAGVSSYILYIYPALRWVYLSATMRSPVDCKSAPITSIFLSMFWSMSFAAPKLRFWGCKQFN